MFFDSVFVVEASPKDFVKDESVRWSLESFPSKLPFTSWWKPPETINKKCFKSVRKTGASRLTMTSSRGKIKINVQCSREHVSKRSSSMFHWSTIKHAQTFQHSTSIRCCSSRCLSAYQKKGEEGEVRNLRGECPVWLKGYWINRLRRIGIALIETDFIVHSSNTSNFIYGFFASEGCATHKQHKCVGIQSSQSLTTNWLVKIDF